MNNTIFTRQNEDSNLYLLAAQRKVYQYAKRVMLTGLFLTLPSGILLAVCVFFYPNARVWAVFISLVISILNTIFLDSIESSLKNTAAKIQEMFDTAVLKLEWNSFRLGKKIGMEEIISLAEKYKIGDKDFATLRNWYPVSIDTVPIEFGRIICQRSNINWNYKIRSIYSVLLVVLVVLSVMLIFIIGLISGMTLEGFVLSVLSLSAPSLMWGIKEYQKQSSAVKRIDNLKCVIDDIWESVVNGTISLEDLNLKSRELQDEIFNHRRNDPLVFDWIYLLFKTKQEHVMLETAEYLVANMGKK